MSDSLKERVYEIYRTFSQGDFETLADMFDENVVFFSNAPVDVFPYLGPLKGRQQVMKALRAVHDDFNSVEYVPMRVIVDGQTAGVILSVRLTQRATGRLIRVFASHFLQFEDNRIADYRAFLDTFETVQQVLGREFDLW